jgi:chemotaxis protein methyltransferase CheR
MEINVSKTELLSLELKQAFIRLIAKHTGLEIKERDQATLGEKIYLRMNALNLDFPERYYQFLKSSVPKAKQEWLNLSSLLTNNDSYFFRDKEQFSLLQHHILPKLIERKKEEKTLRVCSAGCSSGEEPYSLAILLRDLIPDFSQWDLSIFGIDINQTALQKAKIGEYSAWSFRGVNPEAKRRYFQLQNDKYYLDEQIKQMVTFQALNLVNDPFPQKDTKMKEMDLILCRNVFIYFDVKAIANVLSKFYQALSPFGYLLTGHAEIINQDLSLFQTKVFPESIVYQRQMNNLANASLPISLNQLNYSAANNDTLDESSFLDEISDVFRTKFEKNNIKMQRTALNLLRQLSPGARILRLNNLTVAELILKLERDLKDID